MPEWVNPLFTSVFLPSIIASIIGYLSVQAQTKATRATVRAQINAAREAEQARVEAEAPVKSASVAETQQGIYQKMYTSLEGEITRLRESHTRAEAETRSDYETKIAALREEFGRRLLEQQSIVMKQAAQLEEWSVRWEKLSAYQQELDALKVTNKALVAEVAELRAEK